MQELQTFLQKKKGQDTVENHRCKKKGRKKKTALLRITVVGIIPFLAPPVGTDPSAPALAAVANSISKLFGGEKPEKEGASAAAATAENEEAANVTEAHMAGSTKKNVLMDFCRVATEYTTQTWNGISRTERGNMNIWVDMEDELQLLRLSGEDRLSDDDVLASTGEAQMALGGFGRILVTGTTWMDGWDAISSLDGAKPMAAGKAVGGTVGRETDGTTDKMDKTAAGGTTGKADKTVASGTADKTAAGGTKGKADKTVADGTTNQPQPTDIPSALSMEYNKGYAALELSVEQLTVLETIVEAEAGDEDAYGKILVANVVLNRVLDEEFPDTVKEVVFQNNGKTYQFSPVRKGGRYYTVKVSKHTKAAVKRALAGEDYSDGALYFFARRYTSSKKANWFDTSLRKIVEYGCHEFFGNK